MKVFVILVVALLMGSASGLAQTAKPMSIAELAAYNKRRREKRRQGDVVHLAHGRTQY